MQLTESERSLISQALVLAADKYIGFAAEVGGFQGGVRIRQQLLRQSQEVRYLSILFGDAESASIEGEGFSQGGYHGELKEEAANITNQQFADTIKERLSQETTVK